MPQLGEIRRAKEIGYKVKRGRGKRVIWHACLKCAKERWVEIRGGDRLGSLLCQKCAASNYKVFGKDNPFWKGGRWKDRYGYIQVKLQPDDFFYPMANKQGYVREHRLVVAKHLGRCLSRWEIVHHKNGIRDDNENNNLELTASVSEHILEHTKGYKDGYNQGYYSGKDERIKQLQKRIRELEQRV